MSSLKLRDANGSIAMKLCDFDEFLFEIAQSRKSQGDTILKFPFNKSRCRILSKTTEIIESAKGVLYWMSRDCRIHDNWALLYAQRLALKNKQPLYVCFTLFEAYYQYPTRRHQRFLLDGLKCVDEQCKSINVKFYLLQASPSNLAQLVKENNLGAVVCDFTPLKQPCKWLSVFLEKVPFDIPVIQVDAHNIVPAWILSDKQEVMARTLRPKINKNLPEYLTGFPEVTKHPYKGKLINIPLVEPVIQKVSWDIPEIPDIKAGEREGFKMLHTFLQERLRHYGITSNDPSLNQTSNLSFWLNFGHISAQRVALEVQSLENVHKLPVDRFLEELIVRRELADNYCLYNNNYDNIKGAAEWAQKTLLDHAIDKRNYIYSRREFEMAKTHDLIWNAAQKQLRVEGKIHGYMRMYWCKKILEWTESPDKALEIALWLNDVYALDGNDPNGFVGVMWSICGVHDQGWKERKIFGKIRYMVDYSLKRKFNIKAYCDQYLNEKS
ncbi:hypothetical protein ABEB36_006835 [Hypothenemus hampei]|uniref:Deoxyribodipyrimidine photo-lyase n=1 Tax=Hypothenemus hampei TaxID=57062 RepID=A0ABD1ESE5_HYPHA